MAKKRRKTSPKQEDSHLERQFLQEWKARYPTFLPTREYTFSPTRKFRFDFAWPTKKIAVEIQGYGPGHNSLMGMTQDYNKHYEALVCNWKVIYFTSIHLSQSKIHLSLGKVADLLGIPKSVGYIPYSQRRKNIE